MILTDFLPAEPGLLWRLALQTGVRHAVCKCAPDLTGLRPPWDIDALRTVQRRFSEAGITLYGLEGDQFDMRRIKLGLDGRDEDIALYCQMLENMGELGIPLLCYNFMAGTGWHRTDFAAPARGGALTTRFDHTALPADPEPAEGADAGRIRENFDYFLKSVIPVAERVGVRMGMHPDDPPIARLNGFARVLHTPGDFVRALAAVLSPANGVTFCQANFQLMGCDVREWARRFAAHGRIHFVHFRDVRGTADCFEETFHDEGPTNMPAMLKLYHDLGFSGPIRVDHVPTMAGEENSHPGYGALGRLFAIGYLKGIMHALDIPCDTP